jgi:hypothetical protein
VSEIVLPDGSTASEVIGPDGNVVFEAGPDIPDSVVVQYRASEYTQGSSTWAADRGPDMSITGDPQTETLQNGEVGVRGDGTDDFGSWDPPASLEGSSLESFSIEFSVQFTTGDKFAEGSYSGSDTSINLSYNVDEAFNVEEGNFRIQLVDDSDSVVQAAPQSNPNLDDGNTHKVSIIINNAPAPDIEFIVDNSSFNTAYDFQDSLDNFGAQDINQYVFARNNQGSPDNYGNIAHGIIRWHDTAISSQTI